MHFDFLHALVIAVALIATKIALDKTGAPGRDAGNRWSWKRFLASFGVVLVINLLWPV